MAHSTSDVGAGELAQLQRCAARNFVVWAFVVPEVYRWHGDVEVLDLRDGDGRRWKGGRG